MIQIIRTSMSLMLLACVITLGRSAENGKGLGDGHDGNRTSISHVITLYDEKDVEIKPTVSQPRPISMRNTCGKCHDYDAMATGWHFHSGSTNVLSGRSGEPWVLTDTRIRTQIPISNRGWKGTYKPSDINMTAWKFLKQFSSHFPGGNYGEMMPSDDDLDADPEEFLRWPISGKYEINCLACHHADRKQNQSDAALQAARENYRWAATVASGIATVKGAASELDEFYDPETEYEIVTSYDKSRFDSNNKVFLDIVRKPPSNRCYYCHSTQDLQTPGKDEWVHNEDVHLASGMSCSDCHRNGVDHMIARGDIEPTGNPHSSSEYLKKYDVKKVASYSCRGCHLGNSVGTDAASKMGGHLGAPIPDHKGIPPIHFEKLSCTACHSGRLPEQKTGRVRTARIHKLGLHGRHTMNKQLPHVVSPVFARSENGKITPHNMIWPSFWGVRTNGIVKPIAPDLIREIASDELGVEAENPERINDWIELSEEQIGKVLKLIDDEYETDSEEDKPMPEAVYVAAGKLFSLDNGNVVSSIHDAAKPYKWPIAHDVRPASQSLGSNGRCQDCHSQDSPFIFGQVEVDTPFNPDVGQFVSMTDFEELDPLYYQSFAFTFLFRPWLKGVVIVACILAGLVLLLFALKGIDRLVNSAGKNK